MVCNSNLGDDGFTNSGANVICRMMGYSTGNFDNPGYYRSDVKDFMPTKSWLDDVHCSGSESHIDDCPHLPWGNHNCDVTEAIAVRCFCKSVLFVMFRAGDPSSLYSF